MTNILTIATAGLQPGQFEGNNFAEFGRVDYLELRRRIGVDILNYDVYDQTKMGHMFRNLEVQMRSDFYLALLGARQQKDYDLVFTMSERAGLPIAAFRRFTKTSQKFVTMFQSWSWRQEFAVKRFNLFPTMDAIFVHCKSMKDHFIRMGACADKIHMVPYSADQNFFTPQSKYDQQPNLIFSIGETRSRDYGMLFRAVEGLSVDLLVAAGGSWYAREKRKNPLAPLPDNVLLTGHLSQNKLREFYARSQFVVLPIHDLIYSAGSTGAMEAASMGRAVIATRSRGITDFIIDGETGMLVSPGDEYEMKTAIEYLINNPEEAHRLGRNARQQVEEKQNFDNYVDSMANLLLRYR